MLRPSLALALAALLAAAAPAAAQIKPAATPEAAAHWRALAQLDLEAAYALVRDNHPAAVPELGDDAFRANLDKAITQARARLAQVDSYGGYAAVLNGFAVSLGDKHIWSRQAVRPSLFFWPGLAIARRGDSWQVAADARGVQPSLVGAKLIGCDGRNADDMAADKLGGYRAVWSVEAQRVQNAPWLLIDDGNPFTPRPTSCEFEPVGAARRSIDLQWTRIGGTTLSPYITKSINVGSAGMGVRRFAGGYWIALESLGNDARAVADAVKAQAADLRSAPMVVLDMRGNGGGDSAFGDEIATALMGASYVRGAETGGADCNDSWRATQANVDGLKALLADNAASMSLPNRMEWDATVRRIEDAVRGGRAFERPVKACPGADAPEPAPLDGRGSLLTGRLVLLTDADCFSSCLLVAKKFRRLGALHVGGATDAATRYMEVREVLLPSGLSYASTLQKVAPAAPRQIGPFTPSRLYDGDMADTAALETWVTGLR